MQIKIQFFSDVIDEFENVVKNICMTLITKFQELDNEIDK